VEFSKNFKRGRSPDFETIFRKAWSFLEKFKVGKSPDIETIP
jgi:hypothetical protein